MKRMSIFITVLCSISFMGMLSSCDSTSSSSSVVDPSTAINDPSETPSGNDLSSATYIGVVVCKACHPDQYAEWNATKHSTAHFQSFQNSDTCAPCHATGFGESGGFVSGTSELEMAGVQCEVCHGPGSVHIRAGLDQKAATINKIPKAVDTCQNCHRGRPYIGVDLDNATDVQSALEASLTGSGTQTRHPLHYGINATNGKGVGGFEYEGTTYTDTPHFANISNSCVACHLNEQTGSNVKSADAGHHDLAADIATCQSCHSTLTSFDFHGSQTAIRGLLLQLRDELDTYEATFTSKTDRTHQSYERALWNYTFVNNDGANGIHNVQYALKLLQDALANFDPANP